MPRRSGLRPGNYVPDPGPPPRRTPYNHVPMLRLPIKDGGTADAVRDVILSLLTCGYIFQDNDRSDMRAFRAGSTGIFNLPMFMPAVYERLEIRLNISVEAPLPAPFARFLARMQELPSLYLCGYPYWSEIAQGWAESMHSRIRSGQASEFCCVAVEPPAPPESEPVPDRRLRRIDASGDVE